MWTDQELNQYSYNPEGDPSLAHFAIVMYVLAAAAGTALTIFIVFSAGSP